MSRQIQVGLDVLLSEHADWLRGRRVGLLAHPASVDAQGVHAATRLHDACQLTALFGPEHGFHGHGGAGEQIAHERHPEWNIPIHSLYGDRRKPTPEMLEQIDVLVFDLQDIAVRCYTFVSTLRYVMEECARAGKSLIVCDRPIPFPDTVDGPMLDPVFESFVACVSVPLVYGMTPGETALYLHHTLAPDLDLHISRMRGWRRDPTQPDFPWIPPSPGIRTWETAWCYPATVWGEALTAVGVGRGGPTPFQTVSAPWLDAAKLSQKLKLPGLSLQPLPDGAKGVKLEVTDPRAFKPVTAGLHIVHALGEKAWDGAREEWFDKLMGTDKVRLALKAGEVPEFNLDAFQGARMRHLIYK